MQKQNSGFSIIEVLVGILIFSLGLVGVYALISSSLRLNDYNKNFIIASNLAREQLELIKHIRDVNYKTLHKWNQINPLISVIDPNIFYGNKENFFQTGTYYKIENDFSVGASFPVKVEKITDFGEGKSELSGKMTQYNLCLDENHIYTYRCTPTTTKTPFYRYLLIEPITSFSGGTLKMEKDAYKVTSKVIWYMRGYNETELDTIITDWKRL